MINKQVKERFGTWTAFCEHMGEDLTNFRRKIFSNIERLNKWLLPLGLEIKIILKKWQALLRWAFRAVALGAKLGVMVKQAEHYT